jgi:hypothetical protein
MKKIINQSFRFCKSAYIICSLLLAVNINAQTYQSGDIGNFGMPEKWNYNSPVTTLNSTNDAVSFDFSVPYDLTTDRAMVRLIGIDSNTTIRIGIMSDDGTGAPSGTYLKSAVVDPVDGNSVVFHTFGSINLTAETRYHLVIKPETINTNTAEAFMIYASSYKNNSLRAYDRKENDLTIQISTDGGAWSFSSRGAFFALGNGSDEAIAGTGQPYKMQYYFRTSCQGGTGNSTGQRFVIFDNEIPYGAKVLVSNITFSCIIFGTVTNDLLVELREDDLTVLTSATLTNGAMSTTLTENTINWDTPVWLEQGTPYLVTFSFIGTRPDSTDYIRINSNYAMNYTANTTWGGTNYCYSIKSAPSGNWSSYSAGESLADIIFSMSGLVYLNPRGTIVSIK